MVDVKHLGITAAVVPISPIVEICPKITPSILSYKPPETNRQYDSSKTPVNEAFWSLHELLTSGTLLPNDIVLFCELMHILSDLSMRKS